MIQQTDPIYWDFDEAADDAIRRHPPLDLNEDVRRLPVLVIGDVMHGTFNDAMTWEVTQTLQSLIDRNYIYYADDGYELAWRGEAAAVHLLRKGLIMLSPAQQSILSGLMDGTYTFRPGDGRAIKILKEAGYLAKSSAGWQITPDGRKVFAGEATEPVIEPEVLTQDEAEIEFNMERVTDEAVKRKRRAPAITGIHPMPEADAPDDCATGCDHCIPRQALNLILKKHPEYLPVLDALRVLQQFED